MLVLLLLIIFLLEASYAADKFLFKIIIDNGTEFVDGTLGREDLIGILLIVAAVFLGILIIGAVLKFFHLHFLNRFEGDLIIDLKKKFFNHIVHLSHSFHISHKTGSLISRIVRGGNAIERMTDVIVFNAAPLLFQLIVVSGSLLYFSFKSSIVVILTVAGFIMYSVLIQNKQKNFGLDRNVKEDSEKAYISDVMTNIDSIKYFGKEHLIKKKFGKYSRKTKLATVRFWDFFRYLDSGQSLILGVGVFLLVYFPLLDFLEGTLTLGTLVFIYTVYGNLMGPLFSFVHGIRAYYMSMVDFQDLFEYGKVKNDIKDAKDAKDLKIREGRIEFRNVYFKYPKRYIFKNFNLNINKNQKVALVGHSGCGKTTMIKLLYRLHNLDGGEILTDGKNINKFKQESLRSELSIVPQECVLFDDTIYNNIAFSKPSASRREVMRAMKFAQLDKIVNNFPDKEKTIVGERGVKLSGGEKQRVSIARAILANKKILVLDEATSSLDSKTEYEIQRDLSKLMKNRTSIIVAHRLSTVMHADKIVVMDKGRIVQIGKHKDLIRVKGKYRKLWNLQKGGYIR